MPEFEQDPYGLQDYHDAQLKHYGFKRDAVPVPEPSTAPTVPQQDYQRNEAAGMPVPAAAPKRKPVPGAITLPASRNQSPDAASSRAQTPERVIYTRADGRFDPSTIRTTGTRSTTPSSPVYPRSRPTSPAPTKPSVKRSDTNTSNNSWRARRDSIEQGVRRLSISLKEKAEIVAMDRNERVMFVRNRHIESEGPNSPARPKPGRSGSISRGEQIALSISKAVDPLKTRGRSGTNDSSMSMGLTDVAPEGELPSCSRCHRPVFDYLSHGLCQQCKNEVARNMEDADGDTPWVDPWQFPQGRHTYPESPEHGYMKLPSKKILRIRQTIYLDPGNPFADEVEEATGTRLSGEFEEKTLPPTPPLDDINRKRRSRSIALPTSRTGHGLDEDVTPSSWRKHSMIDGYLSRGEQGDSTHERDTRFYGFYDDILNDYRTRDSRRMQ